MPPYSPFTKSSLSEMQSQATSVILSSRTLVIFYPRRAKRALGSEENSSCLLLIDSEMAGPIKLKLGGMVEGMQENVLAKEFF